MEAAGVVDVLRFDAGVDFARVAVRGFHLRMTVGRTGQGACGKPRVALWVACQMISMMLVGQEASEYRAYLASAWELVIDLLQASDACWRRWGCHLRQHVSWTLLILEGWASRLP